MLNKVRKLELQFVNTNLVLRYSLLDL